MDATVIAGCAAKQTPTATAVSFLEMMFGNLDELAIEYGIFGEGSQILYTT